MTTRTQKPSHDTETQDAEEGDTARQPQRAPDEKRVEEEKERQQEFGKRHGDADNVEVDDGADLITDDTEPE